MVEVSPRWHALGYSTTSVERASGQHAKDLLVIIEEASGVEDEIWNALDSLKYSKLVAIGNPIRAEGRFVDLIRQADKDREDCIPPNKAVYAIRIPSTESPHAHLEKSPYGLADRTWLEACYRHYGSNSLWVGSHIDARIPELSADVLMSKAPFQARVGRAWNDRAGLPGFLRENGGLNPVRRTELDVHFVTRSSVLIDLDYSGSLWERGSFCTKITLGPQAHGCSPCRCLSRTLFVCPIHSVPNSRP